MAFAIAPFIVAIVGLLIWFIVDSQPAQPAPPSRPKLVELGRILFWVGTLVTLWASGSRTMHVGEAAVAIVPVVALIVGMLLWFGASSAKVCEVGRVLFWTGTLVTTILSAAHVVTVG